MREKLFTLTGSQREAMWRRFKQTDDHRIIILPFPLVSKMLASCRHHIC
jgi:hypothetical protein